MMREDEMANTWKENLTWRSGLLSEIPVSRWRSVRGSRQIAVLVFRKRSSGPPRPGNLVLEQVLQAGGPSMRKSILEDPRQFFCASIHLGVHTLPIDCAFITHDTVNGSVVAHVAYKVTNPETLVIGVDDALALLSLRCREAVTDLAESRSFTDVSTRSIKETLERVETSDLGLVITKVLVPDSITWPSGITEPQSEIAVIRASAVRDEVAAETEVAAKKRLAGLLEDKLRSMGITHPAILMRVLSRYDSDYQTILDAAQHFAESQKDSRDKGKDFLVWLIEQDKVPRIELDGLVTGLVGRVTGDVTALPEAVASLLTAPADAPSLPDALSVAPSTAVDGDGSENAGQMGQAGEPVQEEGEIGDSSPVIKRRPPSARQMSEEREGQSYVRRKRDPK